MHSMNGGVWVFLAEFTADVEAPGASEPVDTDIDPYVFDDPSGEPLNLNTDDPGVTIESIHDVGG